MAGKLLLQSNLLPLEAVSLGRLVVDIKNPQRRYYDPFEGEPPSFTKQTESDIEEMSQRLKNIRAEVSLTQFLTLFKTRRTAHGFKVQAVMAVTYTLNQWDAVFRSACTHERTRRWLEEAIEDGKNVYFTVGYRTFVGASAREGVQAVTGVGVSVQLPVSTVAEANLNGVQLGGVFDPSIARSKEKDDASERTFSASGESVYAVQYCKVNFKWFFTRNVESILLGANKWRVYIGIRGEDEENKKEDNTVEAGLANEWTLSENEVIELY